MSKWFWINAIESKVSRSNCQTSTISFSHCLWGANSCQHLFGSAAMVPKLQPRWQIALLSWRELTVWIALSTAHQWWQCGVRRSPLGPCHDGWPRAGIQGRRCHWSNGCYQQGVVVGEDSGQRRLVSSQLCTGKSLMFLYASRLAPSACSFSPGLVFCSDSAGLSLLEIVGSTCLVTIPLHMAMVHQALLAELPPVWRSSSLHE